MKSELLAKVKAKMESEHLGVSALSRLTGIPGARIYKWLDEKNKRPAHPKDQDANILQRWLNGEKIQKVPYSTVDDGSSESMLFRDVQGNFILPDNVIPITPRILSDRNTRSFLEILNSLKSNKKLPSDEELAEILGVHDLNIVSEIKAARRNIQPDEWNRFSKHFASEISNKELDEMEENLIQAQVQAEMEDDFPEYKELGFKNDYIKLLETTTRILSDRVRELEKKVKALEMEVKKHTGGLKKV